MLLPLPVRRLDRSSPPSSPLLSTAGLWASLQFRFVQLQYPGVVIAFERMLVAGCLPVAAAVQTWGMVAGVGMSSSCFFLAALLCGLYYCFGLPLASSFHLAGRSTRTAVGARCRRGGDRCGPAVCCCLCWPAPASSLSPAHPPALQAAPSRARTRCRTRPTGWPPSCWLPCCRRPRTQPLTGWCSSSGCTSGPSCCWPRAPWSSSAASRVRKREPPAASCHC